MILAEQNSLESRAKFWIENVVKDRVQWAVEISEPQEDRVQNVTFEMENGWEEDW